MYRLYTVDIVIGKNITDVIALHNDYNFRKKNRI